MQQTLDEQYFTVERIKLRSFLLIINTTIIYIIENYSLRFLPGFQLLICNPTLDVIYFLTVEQYTWLLHAKNTANSLYYLVIHHQKKQMGIWIFNVYKNRLEMILGNVVKLNKYTLLKTPYWMRYQ